MISYCIAVLRPTYAQRLIDDLVRKSSVAYEILLWLNVADSGLEQFLAERMARGLPLRVVGRTPENVGMRAYRHLFRAAGHRLLVQIDDDVVRVSPGIAERAARVFAKFPHIRQLVADVWQDEYTTGARPPLIQYRCVDKREGLYDGPIDGWFSIYHRSILDVLLSLPYAEYCPIGGMVRHALQRRGLQGLLCTRMKVFHVIGPHYASLFGMLDAEVEKYRRLGRLDIVGWYLGAKSTLPPTETLTKRFELAARTIDAGDALAHINSELRPASSATTPSDRTDHPKLARLREQWQECPPVHCEDTDNILVLRGTTTSSPGSERGIVSSLPYEGVALSFEAFLNPDTCFVAKINQVDALDQTTNSYHLYSDDSTTYLARHDHVFGSVAVARGTWGTFRLTYADSILCLYVGDRLVHQAYDHKLPRGYAFLGTKAGEVCLRNIRLAAFRGPDSSTTSAEHNTDSVHTGDGGNR